MRQEQLSPPLSNPVTYILLALAEQDLHGYGIMQEIKKLSAGEFKVGPGTLYDNLRSLLSAALVREYTQKSKGEEPRRLYHLTDTGADVLNDELKRLGEVVRAGRKRLRLGRPTEAR